MFFSLSVAESKQEDISSCYLQEFLWENLKFCKNLYAPALIDCVCVCVCGGGGGGGPWVWGIKICGIIKDVKVFARCCRPQPSYDNTLTLSKTANFLLFQTERVCRWQFQSWWIWQKVFQSCRKHCGKRRNCSLWTISPFSRVFSKALYCRHVKTSSCLGKG